jgi:hypothetical protein
MCNSFLDFWNGERVDAIGSNRGKLIGYILLHKDPFWERKIFKN